MKLSRLLIFAAILAVLLLSGGALASHVTIGNVVLNPGGTGTADVILDSVDPVNGIAGYMFKFTSSDPSVATVTGVTFNPAISGMTESDFSTSAKMIHWADINEYVSPGDSRTNLVLATLTITAGSSAGSTTLNSAIVQFDGDDPYWADLVPTSTIDSPTLTVATAPVASFTSAPTSPAVGDIITFTDTSTGSPTSWDWDFGDSSTHATTSTATHAYSAPGTYPVKLTVTNAMGSNDVTNDVVISSEPAPVAAFTTNTVSGTSPLTVQFTDASTGTITSYAWDFNNDGIIDSTVQNPSYIYVVGGSYIAKLTVTGPGGSSSATKTLNATCNLKLAGFAVPTGAAQLFANENNSITVSNIKVTGNTPQTTVLVTASDGWSTRAILPAYNSTGTGIGKSIIVGVDPTIRTTAGDKITYTATLDPDNTVPETDETDNTKTNTKTVLYNGYKGVQYWTGKEAPKTYLTFDIHGDLINSFGNSSYKSGKGSTWQTLTWGWTPENLVVPDGATIKAARLYIPYCWDVEHEISGGTTTTTFNGVTITPAHMENDTSNFGAYGQYEYGLVTYDVTSLYVKNGDNIATFTRSNTAGSLSPAGFTLAVVYEDQNATRKQIFINEGWDLLGAATSYSTTEEEATSYQDFTGMTIDMAHALKANLTTFVPWGDSNEGNLYVNGQEVASHVWDYGQGSGTWGENGQPQVAVDTRDVISYLKASGTGNGIAIQSTQSGSPCMVAERAFLVVEESDKPIISVVPVSGSVNVGDSTTYAIQMDSAPNGLSGYNLYVTLADGTKADITSVAYDNTWAMYTVNPTVPADSVRIGAVDAGQKIYPGTPGPYTLATITVKGVKAGTSAITLSGLTMDDDAGNAIDAVLNPGTITVGNYSGPVAAFSATPTSGNAPLTVTFNSSTSSGSISTYQWDFGDGATSSAANPVHEYTAIGSYNVKLTVSGLGGSNTALENGYITVGDGIAPNVTMNATPTTGNYPLTVAFSANTTGNVAGYQWEFGDGSYSTLAAPTHTYTYPGTFTAKVTVTGTGGSASDTKTITATQNAPVAGIVANPESGTAQLQVQFTDASTGTISSYNWSFGDGSYSDEQNPVHTFTSAGIFDVTHTVTGPGGVSFPATKTITVTGLGVDFGSDVTTGLASGNSTPGFGHALPVSFTSNVTGVTTGSTTYLWDFGDGSTSTEQNPVHDYYGHVKSFTVTLTIQNGADAASVTKPAYITTTPYVEAFPKDYNTDGTIHTYYTNVPTDTNGDYVYEDVNGNGRVDYDDVVAFYNAYEYPTFSGAWLATNTDVDNAFDYDYSGNGDLGFEDITALYDKILYH